jgi:hypothetical protein
LFHFPFPFPLSRVPFSFSPFPCPTRTRPWPLRMIRHRGNFVRHSHRKTHARRGDYFGA